MSASSAGREHGIVLFFSQLVRLIRDQRTSRFDDPNRVVNIMNLLVCLLLSVSIYYLTHSINRVYKNKKKILILI